MSFKVEGLRELKGQLEALGYELAQKATAQAIRKAFRPVLDAAQARVPVDTGILRESIKQAVKKLPDSVVTGLRIAPIKGAQKLGRRTLSAHWRWHFVEKGTVKMAAKPFLRPALDANAQAVLRILTEELAKAVKRAAKRKAGGK